MSIDTDIESNVNYLKALVSVLPSDANDVELIDKIIFKATYIKDLINLAKDKPEIFVGYFRKYTENGYDIYYHPIGKMTRKQAMKVLDTDIPHDWEELVCGLDLLEVDEETLNQFFVAVRLSNALKCIKQSDCPHVYKELFDRRNRLFIKLSLDPMCEYVI